MNKKLAQDFCNAIKLLAEKPENLENLEHYLTHCFYTWYNIIVTTPEELVSELAHFAEMEL